MTIELMGRDMAFCRPGSGGAEEVKVRSFYRTSCRVVALLFLFALTGCSSTTTRLDAVPNDEQADAVVNGMTGIRYWQKSDLAMMEADSLASYRQEAAQFAASGHKGSLPTANYLAISGGGEDGAYGAGRCWSAGQRRGRDPNSSWSRG